MEIDLTITITVLLALCAIFSPIFVSIINNRYQLKLKRMENFDLAKRNAFENFAKYAGEHISFFTNQSERNMFNALYGLLPFFNIKISLIASFSEITTKDKLILKVHELVVNLKEQM